MKKKQSNFFKIIFYLSFETVMFVLQIFVSHVSLVIFYERIKAILVKSYLNTPSAYLPKMCHNGKKVSICQIMTYLNTSVTCLQYQSPSFWCAGEGGNLPSQILKKGGCQKKIYTEVFLKSPCHRYLPGDGAYYVFCQKKIIIKWNIVLRAKFLNANLDLF